MNRIIIFTILLSISVFAFDEEYKMCTLKGKNNKMISERQAKAEGQFEKMLYISETELFHSRAFIPGLLPLDGVHSVKYFKTIKNGQDIYKSDTDVIMFYNEPIFYINFPDDYGNDLFGIPKNIKKLMFICRDASFYEKGKIKYKVFEY